MFTDPVFRIALIISLLAHAALMMPRSFFSRDEPACVEAVDLNYILIERARLADEEEVLASEAPSGNEEREKREHDPGALSGKIELTGSETALLPDVGPEDDMIQRRGESVSDAGRQEALLRYYNLIREKIRTGIHSASKRREKGTVKLTFTLDASGRLIKINSVTTGGSHSLKRAAISGIKQARPFPPFPEEIGTDPLNFRVIVRFT